MKSVFILAPKITQEMTKVVWKKQTSMEIYNLFRSLYSYKELTTKFKKLNVKLVELKLDESLDFPTKSPGTLLYLKHKKSLYVYCADGRVLEILKLKIDGKKVMNALDFNNGFLKKCSEEEKMFNNL